MVTTECKRDLSDDEIVRIVKKIKPAIEFGLWQTTPENRDDLRQHLYEISIKKLKNIKLAEPKGLFE